MSDEIIKGRVEADVSGYKRGMDEAARATDGFRRQAESAARGGVTTLQAVMGSLGRSLPLVSGGMAGVALAAVGLARSAASSAAEMGRMAEAVGVSAQEMSRYAYAARILNVDTGALQGGLTALTRAIETDSAALKAMGVATRDAAGAQRPLRDVLGDVAERFAQYEGSAAQATLGQAVFGDSWKRVQPLLEQGRDGLADLTDEASTFGAVISDEAAAEAQAFEEDLRRLQGVLPGLAQTLAGPVVSALAAVAEEFNAARRAGLSFMEVTGGVLFNGMADPTKALQAKIADRRREIDEIRNGPWYKKSLVENVAPDKAAAQLEQEIKYLEELERVQARAAKAAEQRGTAAQTAGEAAASAAAAALEEDKKAEREREKAARGRERAAASAAKAAARATAEYQRNAAALDELIERVDAKALEEAEAAVRAYHGAWADLLNGLDDQARSLEEQVELYGLTEAQIAAVTLRRSEETLAVARANGVAPDYLAALEREVELRRQIAGAAGTLEARRANTAAAEQAAREWERTAQEIEGAIYDAIVSGGEDAGEVLERTFKALVLRPIIQPIAQAAAGVVTGALGFGAPGQGGGGSSGGFGMPPGLGSTSMISNGLQWAGSALGSTALGSFGFGMTATSSQIAGLSGAGLINGGAATAGSYFAAAMPYVAVALFAAQALGLFDKKPSDKTSAVTVDTSDLSVDDVWDMGGKKAASQEQKDANTALSLLVGGFAQQVGMDGQIVTAMGARDGTRLAIEGGFDTPMGEVAGGKWLGGKETAYNYGNGSEAIQKMLDDLIDEGTLPKETIDRWRALQTNVDGSVRAAVELVDTLSLINQGLTDTEILRADLIQAEGETLGQAATRIRDLQSMFDPLTADEAWTKATTDLADAFTEAGVAMPATKAAFLDVMDSIDLTTEEGKNLYRSMVDLAPAFYDVASAVDEVMKSINSVTADSIEDIRLSVLDDKGKYEYYDKELDRLDEELKSATNPAEIDRIVKEANSTALAAWNLLDEDEQKRLAPEFISRLEGTEDTAESRLSVIPLDYGANPMVGLEQQEVTRAQTEAATAQGQAAADLSAAAKSFADLMDRLMPRQEEGANGLVAAGNALTSAATALASAATASREVGY